MTSCFYSCLCFSFRRLPPPFFFFFFNDTATTEIYTLSLHDALPISITACRGCFPTWRSPRPMAATARSEEHTSELQSHLNLVCRLLLEKKKNKRTLRHTDQAHAMMNPACYRPTLHNTQTAPLSTHDF